MSPERISARVFELVFSGMPLEFLVFNADDLKISHVNARAQQNLQYSIAELTSMTLADIQPGVETTSLDRELHRGFGTAEMEGAHFPATNRRRDGTAYDVELTLLRIKEAPMVYLAFALETTFLRNSNKETALLP